jgi:hypothetical protein
MSAEGLEPIAQWSYHNIPFMVLPPHALSEI